MLLKFSVRHSRTDVNVDDEEASLPEESPEGYCTIISEGTDDVADEEPSKVKTRYGYA